MKKSRSVRLVLLGGAGRRSPLAMRAAPPADARFFPTARRRGGHDDEATCQTAVAESRRS